MTFDGFLHFRGCPPVRGVGDPVAEVQAPISRLNAILDRLDVENDDHVRADLIDEAIGLADTDPACAEAWRVYR